MDAGYIGTYHKYKKNAKWEFIGKTRRDEVVTPDPAYPVVEPHFTYKCGNCRRRFEATNMRVGSIEWPSTPIPLCPKCNRELDARPMMIEED